MIAQEGLFDDNPWPEKLTATVVTPGASPRIHGYDVEGDLARNYRFTDLLFLTLTGELPAERESSLFDVAMQLAAPLPVSEAPTHAAVLSRLCGGDAGAVLSTAAIALAEQARYLTAQLASWIAWLSEPSPALPPEALARGDADRLAVVRLREAVGAREPVPSLAHDISRDAALVACFHACGLRRSDQIERAIAIARLPAAVAEGLAASVGDFRNYPANLPPVAYVDEPAS
jgi:hypothetical protein